MCVLLGMAQLVVKPKRLGSKLRLSGLCVLTVFQRLTLCVQVDQAASV